MFGHKTIYKVANLKVHSKGRYIYIYFFLIPFKNYNKRLVWTTKLFSCICDITNCKSRLLKFDWLAGGENTWLSTAPFKIETQCGGVFLYHCISDGNRLFSVIFISFIKLGTNRVVCVWGERYCNNVNYVKNNVIFEPPSMRACFSTPPTQNQDFVKGYNMTPLKNSALN